MRRVIIGGVLAAACLVCGACGPAVKESPNDPNANIPGQGAGDSNEQGASQDNTTGADPSKTASAAQPQGLLSTGDNTKSTEGQQPPKQDVVKTPSGDAPVLDPGLFGDADPSAEIQRKPDAKAPQEGNAPPAPEGASSGIFKSLRNALIQGATEAADAR